MAEGGLRMVLVDTDRYKAIEALILVCREHAERRCPWWTDIRDALGILDATEPEKP
jgi:hypothetical protein